MQMPTPSLPEELHKQIICFYVNPTLPTLQESFRGRMMLSRTAPLIVEDPFHHPLSELATFNTVGYYKANERRRQAAQRLVLARSVCRAWKRVVVPLLYSHHCRAALPGDTNVPPSSAPLRQDHLRHLEIGAPLNIAYDEYPDGSAGRDRVSSRSPRVPSLNVLQSVTSATLTALSLECGVVAWLKPILLALPAQHSQIHALRLALPYLATNHFFFDHTNRHFETYQAELFATIGACINLRTVKTFGYSVREPGEEELDEAFFLAHYALEALVGLPHLKDVALAAFEFEEHETKARTDSLLEQPWTQALERLELLKMRGIDLGRLVQFAEHFAATLQVLEVGAPLVTLGEWNLSSSEDLGGTTGPVFPVLKHLGATASLGMDPQSKVPWTARPAFANAIENSPALVQLSLWYQHWKARDGSTSSDAVTRLAKVVTKSGAFKRLHLWADRSELPTGIMTLIENAAGEDGVELVGNWESSSEWGGSDGEWSDSDSDTVSDA